jgi:NitT/TauT family transport system ATP-binding protein
MALRILNINKSFFDKVIFRDFSYTFTETGLYALIGDSGIGKTTLLRLISGLDLDYSGEITGGGPKNVSFAFQEYRLFPQLSALENLTEVVFKNATDQDFETAKHMLLRLGFSEKDINLNPDQLSGGMKQRVSLARAFLKKSSVLILDEPTKELDEELSNTVRGMICEEAKKRLVIVVTHNKKDVYELNPRVIDLNLIKNS